MEELKNEELLETAEEVADAWNTISNLADQEATDLSKEEQSTSSGFGLILGGLSLLALGGGAVYAFKKWKKRKKEKTPSDNTVVEGTAEVLEEDEATEEADEDDDSDSLEDEQK